jgi:CelD/BcsL family acetyltransferase involved in cellulose biosynthesis
VIERQDSGIGIGGQRGLSAAKGQGQAILSAIVYHADLNEAQADGAIAALLSAGPSSTPFDRLDWFCLLAQECLVPAQCRLAVARDGDAIAVLPLKIETSGEVSSLGNWYSFISRALSNDPLKAPTLLRAMAGDLARRHDRIVLSPLPEEDAEFVRAGFAAAGWLTFLKPCDVNHYLSVGGRSFSQYWTERPGRLRETVRRKGKKGVVALRITDAFNEADWAAYEAIYRLSWKPEEGSPSFLRRLAKAEAALGHLRMGLATIDGQPVAAQFWTVEGGTAFIHKLAHDEAAKAHSPGTLLSAALFEHVIDQDKVTEIDFGTGNDPYKRDWMEAVRPRYRLEAVRPLAIRRWPALTRMAIRAVAGRLGRQTLVSAEAAG